MEIDSLGNVTNPNVVRGISTSFDQKAIELIKNMPRWKPAYKYGNPVRSKVYLPIHINFQ